MRRYRTGWAVRRRRGGSRAPAPGAGDVSRGGRPNDGFATRQVHAGVEPDPVTGSILTPIHQTTTYVQPSVDRYREKGLLLLAFAQPHRAGPRDQARRARRGSGRLRVRHRHGRDPRRPRRVPQRGRPRDRLGRDLRRHPSPVPADPRPLRGRVHVRRHLGPRRGGGEPARRDPAHPHRDAGESYPQAHRHRGRLRDRAPPGRPPRRRQHPAHPLVPAPL